MGMYKKIWRLILLEKEAIPAIPRTTVQYIALILSRPFKHAAIENVHPLRWVWSSTNMNRWLVLARSPKNALFYYFITAMDKSKVDVHYYFVYFLEPSREYHRLPTIQTIKPITCMTESRVPKSHIPIKMDTALLAVLATTTEVPDTKLKHLG